MMDYNYGQSQNNEQDNQNPYTYQEQDIPSYNYNGGYSSSPKPPVRQKKSGKGGFIALCVVFSLIFGSIGGAAGTMAANRFLSGKESGKVSLRTDEAVAESTSQASSQAGAEETVVAGGSQVVASTSEDSVMSVKQITENCLPSVVAITNKGEKEIRSMWGTIRQDVQNSGSGVIIGETAEELLVITNYHVVEGSEELSVLFSYQETLDNPEIVEAKVKDYDEARDLAIIAIKMSDLTKENLDNIKLASIGNSGSLGLGDQVVAIGNALGYGQSVTTGIVSALNRTVEVEGVSNSYIQTDAAINPGNSGGALFNMYGQLVGINSVKAGGTEVEGMGYAIPITDVKDQIETMMNTETRDVVEEADRGYLGIQTPMNVTSEISASYGIPEGVYISEVTKDSPAEKAGLKQDMVITALNGKKVSDITALKTYLSYYKAGEEVTLTVQVRGENGYQESTVKVVLGSSKEAGITQQSEAPAQGGQGNVEPDMGSGNLEDFFKYFGGFGY